MLRSGVRCDDCGVFRTDDSLRTDLFALFCSVERVELLPVLGVSDRRLELLATNS